MVKYLETSHSTSCPMFIENTAVRSPLRLRDGLPNHGRQPGVALTTR